MNKIFTLIALFILLTGTAKAQQTFSAAEFKKKLNKTGTLCDTVYSVKIISDTLTWLSMGASYPKQKYIVAVKGNKISLDWANLKGKHLCVTGVFLLNEERPEIDIAEPEQINVQ